MKVLRIDAGSRNNRKWQIEWWRSALLTASVLAIAMTSCSSQTAPNASAAAPAAAPATTDVSRPLKSWEGTYTINFAEDLGSKKGGGNVIWNSNSNGTNEIDLRISKFTLGGLESYECGAGTKAQAAWQQCRFFRLGTKEVTRPNLEGHPLPVGPWDKNNQSKSIDAVHDIGIAVLTGGIRPDTERLVGSFIKDGQIEYLVLYRIADGIKDGDVNKDLLFIDLQDPSVTGSAFENGWGTGGKH